MQYYILEMEEGNRIPYNINKNRAIDIRMLTKEKVYHIPMWNVMEMNLPGEWFFPDLLCSPCIMVSRCFMDTILMYHPDTPFRGVKLWDRESGVNATYFIPILDEVECISSDTQFNNIGNRIIKLVLEENSIKPYAAFRIKDYNQNCIVGRMDFVESLLRRGVRGIKVVSYE